MWCHRSRPDDRHLFLQTGKEKTASAIKIVQAGDRQNDRKNEDNRRSRNPFDPSHRFPPLPVIRSFAESISSPLFP
jgi:hypothetical protein